MWTNFRKPYIFLFFLYKDVDFMRQYVKLIIKHINTIDKITLEMVTLSTIMNSWKPYISLQRDANSMRQLLCDGL